MLKPIGALVEADAETFRTVLLKAQAASLGRVVVDATAVPFVDSQGLEALAEVSEELGASGRSLKLCGASATVRQVLELTGWAGVMEFYDDTQAGVRSFL